MVGFECADMHLSWLAVYFFTNRKGEVRCGEYERNINHGNYFFVLAAINTKLTVFWNSEIIKCVTRKMFSYYLILKSYICKF